MDNKELIKAIEKQIETNKEIHNAKIAFQTGFVISILTVLQGFYFAHLHRFVDAPNGTYFGYAMIFSGVTMLLINLKKYKL